jgi:hypothetical protein
MTAGHRERQNASRPHDDARHRRFERPLHEEVPRAAHPCQCLLEGFHLLIVGNLNAGRCAYNIMFLVYQAHVVVRRSLVRWHAPLRVQSLP